MKILNPPIHRPKIDEYKEHVFIVFHRVTFEESVSEITEEQVSFVLGSNYLISIHQSGLFDRIKENFLQHDTELASRKVDFLLYLLLDKVIEDCFSSVQKLEGEVERLEEQVVSHSEAVELNAIYQLKKKIIRIIYALFLQEQQKLNSLLMTIRPTSKSC